MLYIVSTPIGNLKDITLRALEVLESVDMIAAEDTRHTAKLLYHYNIHKPLISYFEHNKIERGALLVSRLKQGVDIALVSDAGTPAVSDPGEHLVNLAIENGIEYTVIPGPAACITALVLSGLPTERFAFEGFLPEDKKKLAVKLDFLRNTDATSIFYESPHNIIKTLRAFSEFTDNRQIVLCREMTKKFEQVIRGTAREHLEMFESVLPRGEYVIVVEGKRKNIEDECLHSDISCYGDDISEALYEAVASFAESGMSRNAAIKAAAVKLGISRNDAYNLYEEQYRKTLE